jgi:ArsR family transcriptional regulator
MPKQVGYCAAILKVLADETRLAVLRQLMGELNAALKMEQSLLSHHLRVLRDAGLVLSTRDGKAVLYRLAEGVAVGEKSADSINLGCCQLSFGARV